MKIPAVFEPRAARIARHRRAKKWNKKQAAAYPRRYYGDGGTIHDTTHIDVCVDADGVVQSVWFRCQPLPFEQHEARPGEEAFGNDGLPKITGVEVLDPKTIQETEVLDPQCE